MTHYPSEEPEGAGDAAHILERAKAMVQFTPQARALGIELVSIDGKRVRGRAPYRKELIGDPTTGVIAGGVLTTFLDQISGVAAVVAMEAPSAVATIDLRIDYMRAADPGRDIFVEAECIRMTRTVAFVRAEAFEDAPDKPIAHAMATFMLGGQRRAK